MFNRNKKRIELLEKEIQRLKETNMNLERRVDLLETREMQRQPNGFDLFKKW